MVKWWLPAKAEARTIVEAMLELDSAAREVSLAYLPRLRTLEVDGTAEEALGELDSAVTALQRATSKLETAAYRAEDAEPDDPDLPRWPHVKPKLIRVLERAEHRLEAAIDACRDVALAGPRSHRGRRSIVSGRSRLPGSTRSQPDSTSTSARTSGFSPEGLLDPEPYRVDYRIDGRLDTPLFLYGVPIATRRA